jgi:hypothetical protein
MLPTVAQHAISTYTAPGDLVIDPLAGVGTTLVEATHLGRNAVGIEYEPGWATLAVANLQDATGQGATGRGIVVADDATRLPDMLPSQTVGTGRHGAHLPAIQAPSGAWRCWPPPATAD